MLQELSSCSRDFRPIKSKKNLWSGSLQKRFADGCTRILWKHRAPATILLKMQLACPAAAVARNLWYKRWPRWKATENKTSQGRKTPIVCPTYLLLLLVLALGVPGAPLFVCRIDTVQFSLVHRQWGLDGGHRYNSTLPTSSDTLTVLHLWRPPTGKNTGPSANTKCLLLRFIALLTRSLWTSFLDYAHLNLFPTWGGFWKAQWGFVRQWVFKTL